LIERGNGKENGRRKLIEAGAKIMIITITQKTAATIKDLTTTITILVKNTRNTATNTDKNIHHPKLHFAIF